MFKIVPNGSNQTILKFGPCEILFSYETPVAGFDGTSWFRTEEKFSRTTSKHINRYLGDVNAKLVSQNIIDDLSTRLSSWAKLVLPLAEAHRAKELSQLDK